MSADLLRELDVGSGADVVRYDTRSLIGFTTQNSAAASNTTSGA